MDSSPLDTDLGPAEAPAFHALPLWRTLLEATSDGVLVVGAHGRVLATNPAFCRLFALRELAGTLTGVSLGDLCDRLGEAFADA
ncbi:MAG TPA: PAS domain-containing protein, partial [Myxococcaceae bacterium]|nr:PAS domain-containing protein [Myxococcaceae bacterium]